MNLAQIVALHGRYRSDRPAIEAGDHRITYGELDAAVSRIAARLGAAGIGRGDLVGVWLRDRPRHLAALLAVARRGAVVLAMDWRWTPVEAARIFARFPARAALVEAGQVLPSGVQAIGVEDLQDTAPDPSPPAQIDDGPFVYALSSGTTGEPKAAVMTHGAFMAQAMSCAVDGPLLAGDRMLLPAPLAYGAGRGLALFQLMMGSTVVMFPAISDPQEMAEAIDRRRIDVAFCGPPMSRALLRLPAPGAGPRFPNLRIFWSAGAKLHPEERRDIRSRLCDRLCDVYASISAGMISIARPAELDAAPESVGRPTFNAEVELVDDDDRPVPPGEVGWLRVRGPGTAAGFVGSEALGRERIQNGWAYSGDLARFDDRGFLYLAGRSNEIIKRGGVTIYAAEIERVLSEHPAVADAAVVGAPAADQGEEVVAFVVLHQPAEAAALIAHCRRSLAPHKVPQRVVVVDGLPRNAGGKVVKPELLKCLG
jgi:acyl-CoA synthetase (AMP-forming)/AMP-acid ligase II